MQNHDERTPTDSGATESIAESDDDAAPRMSGVSSGDASVENHQSKIPAHKNDRRQRHGARNQHRHKFFVKWLLETFDFLARPNDNENGDTDSSTRHILDVAGGKGEVSARLCMCHSQQVVMVDPRPADIVHCFETLVLPKIPNKWQARLEEQRSKNPNFVPEIVHSRFRQLVTTLDDHRITESIELQAAIQEASLMLGLHADGATEAIVDVALKYQKPFVVVPCCVFPNLFRDRRVMDTDSQEMVPVRSHEQFCQYLLAKDPRFRLETLPFEGRNIAIWWNGK